ncbi:hypothetical protein [Massilia sp. Se16.2.3]|uniref:hypothetical protein n=1 Tax=Massilia sp. Se16.2.3 TaxID=2709303 RepID=UPI001E40BCB0|nr:hypothetical protein [Massilia sp. Se16.2.3]
MSRVERAAEVEAKLALVRACLDKAGAAAIRLRGIDWFAWITAGGSSAVLQTAESGVAEVLVTRDEAVVLTDEIEAARLREEGDSGRLHLPHRAPGPDRVACALCAGPGG